MFLRSITSHSIRLLSSISLLTLSSSSFSLMSSASASAAASSSTPSPILSSGPLGFPFKTPDPFLFCVYHHDLYPEGNPKNMNAPRKGNGADFDWSQPYRMYHGYQVPGFPQHPHRGFETLTLVPEGRCDHTDSAGGAGRYGGDGRAADLQWLTTGAGIVHGENFPLINIDKPNTLRLFQIWLNLPAKNKMVPADYQMYWSEDMVFLQGENGAECEVAAGRLGSTSMSGQPPKNSWAADPKNDVGVFHITLPANGGRFELPAAVEGKEINRAAYIVGGSKEKESKIFVAGQEVRGGRGHYQLNAGVSCVFENKGSSETAEILILQGRPINEPVSQQGPFVMNTQRELQQAFLDYQKTRFGGWPWEEDAVIFPREQDRFAIRVVDGKKMKEAPPKKDNQNKAVCEADVEAKKNECS